ncbi:hypothetical protein GF357_03625 [Candidatus Dojkabacteria bacterium]|nr:hypothetical protein [Candidatus Dojkabacteria bacterium]
MIKPKKIHEKITVKGDLERVQTIFSHFVNNPQEYQFSTHYGVEVGKRPIDKIGARFSTLERFGPINVALEFQTFRYKPGKKFEFKLLKPFKKVNIVGGFEVTALENGEVEIELTVRSAFADNLLARANRFVIFGFPVKYFIRVQLRRELDFIRMAFENNLE